MKKPTALVLAIPADGNGNSLHNNILLSLSPEDLERVLPKLELVHLKLHQVLHEAGQTIKSGYFVNEGMISVLAVHPDGKSVEVGLIGNEGFAGLPLIVGFRSSPTRLITQGDGSAYRCDAETLLQLIRKVPTLERQLHRFGQKLAMQTTQIAACNRLHEVGERNARGSIPANADGSLAYRHAAAFALVFLSVGRTHFVTHEDAHGEHQS